MLKRLYGTGAVVISHDKDTYRSGGGHIDVPIDLIERAKALGYASEHPLGAEPDPTDNETLALFAADAIADGHTLGESIDIARARLAEANVEPLDPSQPDDVVRAWFAAEARREGFTDEGAIDDLARAKLSRLRQPDVPLGEEDTPPPAPETDIRTLEIAEDTGTLPESDRLESDKVPETSKTPDVPRSHKKKDR